MLCITFSKNIAHCSKTILKKKKETRLLAKSGNIYKINLGNFKDSKLSL